MFGKTEQLIFAERFLLPTYFTTSQKIHFYSLELPIYCNRLSQKTFCILALLMSNVRNLFRLKK